MSVEPKQIAFIGLGVMGGAMAGRLLDAGYVLKIHTRTRSKAARLLDAGAVWAESPKQAARGADVLISIVGYPADVRSVYLGDDGVLNAEDAVDVVVDMTTSSPALAVEIAKAAQAKGVAALDAPVSGGDIGARNGTLSVMVGGEGEALDKVRGLFSHLAAKVTHCGGPGAGQHTKLVNQILIASNMVGVCEGLVYAVRAGLDPTTAIEAVSSGAAGSWSISNLGPRIVKRDFAPGFYVEHFIKDMGLALSEARSMHVSLPGLALAEQLYQSVTALGHGRSGTQALILALEALSPGRSQAGGGRTK